MLRQQQKSLRQKCSWKTAIIDRVLSVKIKRFEDPSDDKRLADAGDLFDWKSISLRTYCVHYVNWYFLCPVVVPTLSDNGDIPGIFPTQGK